MRIENIIRYESFIFVGIIIIIGTLIKLLGFVEFSSDWFWLIAGIGLMIEGTISWVKQKKFDRKYKVIEIGSEEYKKLYQKQ
ncbi:MAG: hypothetical protein AABW81_03165 [Nanoarchaeota archaeon]